MTDFARDLVRDEGGTTGLGWSFTVSTWLHIGILVALLFVPATRREEEEKPVPVDLALEAVRPAPPKQEISSLRRQPPSRSSPAPPVAPRTDSRPSSSVPPPAPPERARIREAVPDRLGNAALGAERNPLFPPPPDPGSGDSTLRGEPPPGPGQGTGSESPRDLKSALSEFRQAIARGRTGGGGSGSGGSGGKGGGISVAGLSPSGFGVGNLWFDSRDYDWTPYQMQIYWAILDAWYTRLYAMTEQFEKWAFERGNWMIEHQNQVRFTIQKSGEVTGIEVEGPADCPPLDVSSVDALREVVLPPLPSDSPRSEETVHVRFLVKGDIHHMRNDPLLRAAYYGR